MFDIDILQDAVFVDGNQVASDNHNVVEIFSCNTEKQINLLENSNY